MASNHLQAVLTSISLYVLLGLSYFGWGKALLSIITPVHHDQKSTLATITVWIGWSFTLFIFQLIHLVIPLNFLSVVPILIIGIAFFVFFLTRHFKMTTESSWRMTSPTTLHLVIPITALLLMLSAWIASRSMLPATFYDSGLYHFNTIRWINSYPIIPGLANLHGRLAFNQSFFAYVAALNLYPYFSHGRSIANSFLWILSLLTIFEIMLMIFRQCQINSKFYPLYWAPALFCAPSLAYWALTSSGIQSPSPDLTSSLLQIVIFVSFCRTVAVYVTTGTLSKGDSFILLFLGVTAITVKLSNMAFCGTIMLLVLIGFLKTSANWIVEFKRMLVPLMFVIVVFCLRGYVLSGVPFYPSTIGYVNTEWAVPVDRIIEEQNWVYSWARQPYTHWSNVIGSWNWLVPWFQRVAGEFTTFVYPVVVFLLLGGLNILFAVFYKTNSLKSWAVNSILPLSIYAGLLFWFFTAPNLRFANALFFLLPVSLCMQILVNIHSRVRSTSFTVIVCILFIVVNLNLFHWGYHNWRCIKDISVDGYHGVKQAPLNEKVTRTGLKVYTPVNGDQCWDSPLPCTPYFDENLRLRRPTDILSGFIISRDIQGKQETP